MPELNDELRSLKISFRPITPEDEPFLKGIYASTRAEEMALVDWTDEQKDAFLQMQFAAQHHYYQDHYAGAGFLIVRLADASIGRLYLALSQEELRVIDIALAPEFRGSGIGGAIMRGLLDEARNAGLPVRIHVEKNNPALRLYERMGFKNVEDKGVYWFMEWRPEMA